MRAGYFSWEAVLEPQNIADPTSSNMPFSDVSSYTCQSLGGVLRFSAQDAQ